MSTIDKALDVLELANSAGEEISLAEIAKAIDCNRPTAYRVCSNLIRRGYLLQKQKRGKYSLGYKFLKYCNSKNIISKIKDASYPSMQALCNETSETINLSILEGDHATNIAIVSSETLLQVVSKNEATLPLHMTATGKILLAYLEDNKREALINSITLTANTEKTISSVKALRQEIEKICSEGVAVDNEEYMLGVRSIAVPVFDDKGGVFAALSLIGPSIRISKSSLLKLAPVLKKYAKNISISLGYTEKV